jgi:hypothetical protein
MSKKTSIIVSVIAFVLLVALVVLEKCYPGGGAELISGLIG